MESKTPTPELVPQPPEAIIRYLYGRARTDSYMAVGSRRPTAGGGEAPRFLCPIPINAQQDFLPGVFSWRPHETQYLCPNTLGRGALLNRQPREFLASLLERDTPLYYQFKNKHIRELVAISVDLDVGRAPEDLAAADALSLCLRKVFKGELPPPSLAAYSGRGSYVL